MKENTIAKPTWLQLVQTHNKQHQTSKSWALLAHTYNTIRNLKRKKEKKEEQKQREHKAKCESGPRGGELSLF
jgi:hypothetical protein